MVSLFRRNFNLKVSLIFILSALAVFFCARIALLLMYSTNFEALTTWQIIKAFLNGFRFDYYIVALFLMPCAFMMNLPVKSRLWFKTWLFIGLIILLPITLILIADIIYFPEVNRHIAQEIIQIKGDIKFIVSYAITGFWFILLPLFALLLWAFWFFNKQINKFWQEPKFSYKKLIKVCLIFIILIVLGGRGHLGGGRALNTANAVYKYAKTPNEASLIINGAFSAYHILRKGDTSSVNNYPYDKAIKEVQDLFKEEGSNFDDPDYPLMQFPQSKDKVKDINFVIVMLESWNKPATGIYNPNGETYTPHFDEMAKNGVLFTNAYATGGRSIAGFTSILVNLPLINGSAYGYGLEQNAVTPMPAHFARQGFDTFFIRTANCDSYFMCTLAKLLGVNNNYGAEDIPQILTYKDKPNYGYDYEMFVFAADKIKERKNKNFFAMLFNASTHEPMVDFTDDFQIFKDGSMTARYKNILAYVDNALGVFIDRAKKDGWFDNTVFIFVSDHTGRRTERKTFVDHFAVPLLIYAPKLLKPQVIDYPVSQLDIVPTIYKMASLNDPRTLFGTDLFNKKAKHFAMIDMGTGKGIITKDGAILYDGNKIIDEEKFTEDFNPTKNLDLFLALDKVGQTLLQNDRWYKEENNEK